MVPEFVSVWDIGAADATALFENPVIVPEVGVVVIAAVQV